MGYGTCGQLAAYQCARPGASNWTASQSFGMFRLHSHHPPGPSQSSLVALRGKLWRSNPGWGDSGLSFNRIQLKCDIPRLLDRYNFVNAQLFFPGCCCSQLFKGSGANGPFHLIPKQAVLVLMYKRSPPLLSDFLFPFSSPSIFPNNIPQSSPLSIVLIPRHIKARQTLYKVPCLQLPPITLSPPFLA